MDARREVFIQLSMATEIHDDDFGCVFVEGEGLDVAGWLVVECEEQALDEDEAERTVTRREER